MLGKGKGLSLAGLMVFCGALEGQTTTVLGNPEVAFGHAFSLINTVREMPDGRVLVADPLGQVLVLVHLDAGTADTLGGVGEGPKEYRQPDAVWPLPDGRTLLVDLGNGRLTELSPELEFGNTRPYTVGEVGPGQELVMAIPQGVDASGRLYFRGMGRLGMGGPPDSAHILRMDLESETVDSVGTFKLTDYTRTSSGGLNQNVQISPVPLSPADAWGVALDGRVAIARSADYHLDWISPDGSVTSGPANEYGPVRIRQDEKEEWREGLAETGGGMGIQVGIVNGVTTVMASRGGTSEDFRGGTWEDRYEWPSTKPPFYNRRIPVDPGGRAWVRRHTEAGRAPAYDVFGASGVREMTVELPAGRRLTGFGEGKLYAVRTDEVGLQYLERYGLP